MFKNVNKIIDEHAKEYCCDIDTVSKAREELEQSLEYKEKCERLENVKKSVIYAIQTGNLDKIRTDGNCINIMDLTYQPITIWYKQQLEKEGNND